MEIIGHRGASGRYPENTIPAFQEAWDAGAAGIEFDVQRTRDGRFVVFHDADGTRLAGSPHRVADCTWAACSSWDVGQWKGDAFADLRMPLLEDVLKRAHGKGHVLIEIKCDDTSSPEDLNAILEAFPHLKVSLLTFDLAMADACVALIDRPVLWNVEQDSREGLNACLETCVQHRYSGLSMKWSSQLDVGFIQLMKKAGLMTAVWTVNDMDDAMQAEALGIDWLMTDWPETMIQRFHHE